MIPAGADPVWQPYGALVALPGGSDGHWWQPWSYSNANWTTFSTGKTDLGLKVESVQFYPVDW